MSSSHSGRTRPQLIDIVTHADEHANLLESIARYDGAPAELKETDKLIGTLEVDLRAREKRLAELIKKRKSEAKDFENLQNSKTRRFFVRVRHGGKEGLNKRLEKEEMEYIDAAQAEYNENLAVNELRETVKASKERKADLEAHVAQREEYVRRLFQIYSSVFSGPTPDYPEEDAAEEGLKDAQRHFDDLQATFNHEKQVFEILTRALQAAFIAVRSLQSASRSGTFDTFGVGGIWAELAERDDLLRAQTAATQANMFFTQARRLSQNVRHVQGGEVVQPEWLNVVFDNIFTDIMFQQKMQQSLRSMTTYLLGVETEAKASQSRLFSLEQPVKDAAEFLKSQRRELNAIRREILTRVAEEVRDGNYTGGIRSAGNGSGDELPEYMRFDALAGRVTLPLSEGPPTIVPPADGQGTPAPSYESVIRSEDASGHESPFASPIGPPPPDLLNTPIFSRSISTSRRTGTQSPSPSTSRSASVVQQERVEQVESAVNALSVAGASRSSGSQSGGNSTGLSPSWLSTPEPRHNGGAPVPDEPYFPRPAGPPPPSHPRFSIVDPPLSRFDPIVPTPEGLIPEQTAVLSGIVLVPSANTDNSSTPVTSHHLTPTPTPISTQTQTRYPIQRNDGRSPSPGRAQTTQFASNNPFRDSVVQ